MNKRAEKEYASNITEDIVYNKLFIAKTSNQYHDSQKFIEDSGATSHMVTLIFFDKPQGLQNMSHHRR